MTNNSRYQQHLETAIDIKEVSVTYISLFPASGMPWVCLGDHPP